VELTERRVSTSREQRFFINVHEIREQKKRFIFFCFFERKIKANDKLMQTSLILKKINGKTNFRENSLKHKK